MELNPQIRSLHIRDIITIHLLQLASEKLPNLEILNITISINSYFMGLTASIKFDRLKKLHIHGTSNPFDNNWPYFIAQNHELQTLDTDRLIITLNEWIMIVNNLPHLVEIKADWMPSDHRNELISLMSEQTNLKRITFKYHIHYSRDDYAILRNLVHSKWRIDGRVQDRMAAISFIQNE